MYGFRTSRVLIIDDKPNEALPVLHALGALGIASLYHDCHPDADYTKKHSGIRLLFLDMVLENRSANESDPVAAANILVGALDQILERTSEPLIVVCWTKHKDFKEYFQKAFERAFPETPLKNVLLFNKDDLLDAKKRSELIKQIQNAMESLKPLSTLFGWEQMVHDSATRTTTALASLIQSATKTENVEWETCAYRICAALALAERGTRLVKESPDRAIKALFDALNPLLGDRLDHTSIPATPELSALAETLKQTAVLESNEWPKKSLLSSQLRAALNSMIHLSFKVMRSELNPGDIFFAYGKNADLGAAVFPDWKDVAEDTFISGEKPASPTPLPLVMEISAVCDFAQAKTRLPRFIAGFLVPETLKIVKSSAFTKRLGPLLIQLDDPNLEGVYYLVFNAHYLFSLRPDVSAQLTPSKRLRAPILADFTAWISGQMSRPGPLHIGP
jgi:hypothetical protein